MKGPQKFIEWLLEMGYLEPEDISTDKEEMIADIIKVREVAPKFYNMMMCMCDCEERSNDDDMG